MGLRLAVLASVFLLAVRPVSHAGGRPEAQVSVADILAAFARHRGTAIDAFLGSLRPAPLDPATAARVLESLPRDMPVRPSRRAAEKIAAARRVLAYNARSRAIVVKVFRSDEALAALYFRAAILISTRTMDILDSDELSAVVAHEVAHDFHWDEYQSAIKGHDSRRMQALELRSDGIAVLTLKRLAISPERLVSAVTKMTGSNESAAAHDGRRQRTDESGNWNRYVPLNDRVAFIRLVAKLAWAGESVADSPTKTSAVAVDIP